MNFIRNKSLGFNGNAVIEVNFNRDQNVIQRYASLRNEFLKSPYILNITKHNANIVGGLANGWTTTRNLKGEEVSTSIYGLSVDADYFDTYGMKLAAGRFFSKNIPTDTAKAVLVNEAAVKTFDWQKPENAIGKPFGKGDDTRYVIGVVKDFNFESLHKPVDALLIGFARGENNNKISLKIDAEHIHEAINHLTKTWKNVVPKCLCNIHLLMKGLQSSMAVSKKWKVFFMDSLVCHCL
jgi:putative ABC transport system permease protein